jgi:TatD DNase family protein
VGEVGLDFHYDFAGHDNQKKVFARQIAIARETHLPLVIHSRNAETEVLEILAEEKFIQPVVFHCFTGNKPAAEEILKRGYSISISGIITFKKADALREIAKIIPLQQLFSETDSPYLSPEPRRGETNTPLNVIPVVEKIAEIKHMDVAQINAAVRQNLMRLQAKN